MPYHRIPRAHVHEDLLAIERDGERVVSVTNGDDCFHVFTAYLGQQVETRPLSLAGLEHRARLGVPS